MSDKKIAIIGTAEPHWRAAPFNDQDWDIWTCGGVFKAAPRTTVHFELHSHAETCKGWSHSPEEENAARNVYWQWLASQGDRVVLRAPHSLCPAASIYPLDAVLTAFPDRYFTCSISWMLAAAIIERPKAIGLWGVDMALTGDPDIPASNEYARQRPSVEYYLGIATGSGIEVHLPPNTTLLTARKLYGFEDDGDDKFLSSIDAKRAELQNNLTQAQQIRDQKRMELIEAEKAIQAFRTGLEIANYARRNGEF